MLAIPLPFGSEYRRVALPGERFFAFGLAQQLLPVLSGADSHMNEQDFFPFILAEFP